MTDDLLDDIIWKQGMRMPWFDTRLGHLKKKVYILYVYYISYILHIYGWSKCVLYKFDFIYIIHWLTNVTDDVTDDIFWIQGVRMPWFDTRLGHLKKEKSISYLCVIYLICYIYSI